MSTKSLRSQLEEDYLTCSICFNSFTRPKALPCLHTFCEGCLRDYIVSRGYESGGTFPCPVCRTNTGMPQAGVEGFPDNHLMSSLSDTVANSEPARPKPKPRRSLGQPQVVQQHEKEFPQQVSQKQQEDGDHHHCRDDEEQASSSSYSSVAESNSQAICSSSSKICQHDTTHDWVVVPQSTLPSAPVLLHNVDKDNFTSGFSMSHHSSNDVPTSSLDGANASTSLSQIGQTTFSSDQLIAPGQPPPYSSLPETTFPGYPRLIGHHAAAGGIPEHQQIPKVGWNINNILGDVSFPRPVNHESASNESTDIRAFNPKASHAADHSSPKTSNALYPTVPAQSEQSNVACTENLILKFGKQGSSNRDFLKPVGLAVSKECNYVISDSSGDQNRIFIFNSGGELINAFNCGCKVKDVTMTKENEIFAAVHKNVSAVRHFTMMGQCKGEYGKFFTFEEPCGIGQLVNGGVAISGTQNHCVYVLTDQMKLATKFGRKGNGDGYFQHPAYITVDSKNHIIITDKKNNCVQIFTSEGKFRNRFGTSGKNHSQLESPLGICVDESDNIIVADSGNYRVEVFSSKGHWLRSVVTKTHELGNEVKPVNVAFTPTGKIAVLLRGPYFAEVRVYSSKHKHLVPRETLPQRVIHPCW